MLFKKIIQLVLLSWILLSCNGFAQDKKYDRAFMYPYRDSLIKVFQQKKDMTQCIQLIRLANCYLKGGKLTHGESYEVLQEFLKEAVSNKNAKLLPYVHNALGMIHVISSEGKLIASDYLLHSIEAIKALNDKEWLGETYQRLGSLFYDIGDFSNALLYFRKAQPYIAYIVDDNASIISMYNTYGLIYHKIGAIDSAKVYYNKALKQVNPKENAVWIGILKGNIGTMLYKQKKYAEALPLLEEDVRISVEYKMFANAILSLSDIINLYLETNDIANAEKKTKYLKILIEQVENTPAHLQAYIRYYETNATYYGKIQDYEKAFYYQKLNKETEETYRKYIKDIEIQRIKFRYNYEKKQRDIEKLIKQNEIQQAYLYTVSVSLLTVVLLIVVLGQRYYQKKVLMSKLTIQHEHIKQINEELLQQAIIIDQQNEALQASNASKDKIFTLISHDLRSPLASVKGVVSLLENNLLSVEELQDILPTITSNIDHTLNLSEELLYWATSQMKGIQIELASVNPKYIANQTFLIFTENAQKKNVHLIEDIAVNIPNVLADENMSKTILRNLVANALKFSKEGGTITIIAKKQGENYIKLGVKDTGVGIKAENLPKIFNNEPFTTKGTAGEKGTGFGLMLCKDFVTQHGGEIWVESEWEQGTTFYFTLPIDKNTQAS